MRLFFGLKTILLAGFLVMSFTALSSFDFSASAQNEFGEQKKPSSEFSGEKIVEYKSDSLAAPDANTAFVQQAKLLASDGAAQDSLGFSSAISGDTAIVGAPRNSGGTGLQSRGAAYIYVRSGTTWTQQQKLVPSDGAATDQFGYSVAINGNTAAVGRYNTTTGQNRADGKVYIFIRNGTTWTETQTLVSNDIAQGDLFGNSLAFENDTLVIGALNKNTGSNFFQGAAYVFIRSSAGANFTQQAKLTASDGVFADFFGYSVAVSGDSVIVGATSLAGQPNSKGKAYIFTRSGTSWSQQQILQASDGTNGDAFGFAVGISGDTAVVGARLDDVGAVSDQGSAYVFSRSGASWSQTQQLLGVETTQRNDQFGSALAIKGDTIVIGSPAHEFIGSIANHGAIYVFNRSGGTWTRAQKLVHLDAAPDALGTSVAFDGNSILAGAPSKDSARGAVYIFAPDIYTQQRLTAVNSRSFGHSVAVDGDTLVVGASTEQREHPQTGSWSDGAVYVYVRNGANWIQQARLAANDEANGRQFGESVAISGNTLVVGAFTDTIGANGAQGSAYVFTRSGSTWTFQQKLTANDGAAADNFGNQVSISNDTIAIGAKQDDIGTNSNQGSVYIFTKSGTAWAQAAKIVANDGAANDIFGTGFALSGNTLIVGANGANLARGAAYVYTGSGANWTLQQKLTASDGLTEDEFGRSVSISGDSVVIGAYGDDNGTINRQGSAYVFVRSGTTWAQQAKLVAPDGAATDYFGFSVAISGNQAVIGANLDDITPNINNGSVYVFVRNGTTWTQQSKLVANDANSGDEFGFSVAIDNGQIVVGADEKNIAQTSSSGAVYVFTDSSTSVVNNRSNFDFDGDGKADLSVFRSSEANWFTRQSGNSAFSAVHWGISSDKPTPADFDGDGRTDFAVWRENGLGDSQRSYFFVLRSSDNTVQTEQFGSAGDDPNIVGDWDGDGKADVAVYRAGASGGQGYFYYRPSSLTNVDFVSLAWGASNDKAVRGDFDGDGKLDAAVFRPSERVWYVRRSSDGVMQTKHWGLGDDKLVPADYDGDGKTDFAVFRPSDRTWYILQSANSQFLAVTFGLSSDTLAPADYDGDGKTDLAIYRSGIWIILQTSNGNIRYDNFGTNADVPIAGAHIQ
jgi:hypothetical protein